MRSVTPNQTGRPINPARGFRHLGSRVVTSRDAEATVLPPGGNGPRINIERRID